ILISLKGLQFGPDSAKYNMLSEEELSVAVEEYANMVYSKINNQKSFEEAAKKYSHDNLTGQNGGLVGWTTRGVYLEPFDSIAFSLRKGDIPKPYQDRDGWHIIYCEDYFAGGIPPLNPSLYLAAERSYRNIITNEIGKKLVDSLFSNISVEYNEQFLDSNLYSIDKREWIAIVNGKDTIDCNECRTLELKARERYNVSSTTPEMKKEMLKPLYERYTIIQAARHDRIDTISSVRLKENHFRNKYSIIILEKDRYDYKWTPSDSLIEEYYNEHIENFVVDKPLVVQQIIVQDSILGEFLRDQAMSGVDFLELAQEYYPGEKSIRKDLADLGEISEEDVSKEFFETAMRVPEGDVSHPVKTDFGYHIIKVLERRETMRLDRASHIIIPILKQQHQRYIFERFRDRLYHQFNVRFSGKLYRVHLKPSSLRIIS
ncbi:MAG: peptidylprolyl isomerase, partial [Candidatus Zixiibacteriota bacterium]